MGPVGVGEGTGSAKLLVMNHGDMPYRRGARMRNPRGYRQARVVAQGMWEGWKPGGSVPLKADGDKRIAKSGSNKEARRTATRCN